MPHVCFPVNRGPDEFRDTRDSKRCRVLCQHILLHSWFISSPRTWNWASVLLCFLKQTLQLRMSSSLVYFPSHGLQGLKHRYRVDFISTPISSEMVTYGWYPDLLLCWLMLCLEASVTGSGTWLCPPCGSARTHSGRWHLTTKTKGQSHTPKDFCLPKTSMWPIYFKCPWVCPAFLKLSPSNYASLSPLSSRVAGALCSLLPSSGLAQPIFSGCCSPQTQNTVYEAGILWFWRSCWYFVAKRMAVLGGSGSTCLQELCDCPGDK